MFTAAQLNEWVNSWSPLTIEQYFKQKEDREWLLDAYRSGLQRNQRQASQPSASSGGETAADANPNGAGDHENSTTLKADYKEPRRTKLPNGRLSMLVDIGACIDMIGSETGEEFQAKASQHGKETAFKNNEPPQAINGVGS